MARSSDSFFLLALLKDKTFQTREVRRVIYLSALYLLITTALLAVFYQQMLAQLVSGQLPMLFVSEDIALINEQIPSLSSVLGKWVLVMLGVNVIVTSLVGAYIIRKMGHPLLAIKRALGDLGNGKLDTKLRSSDSKEFAEISDAFNIALEQIRFKIEEAKNELQHPQEQPQPSADELQTSIKNCAVILDYFESTNIDGSQRTSAAG
ncbi:MAG: hypothetical protein KDJ38_03055 [Gammaproteobacteria bacterium]|nr:hypothetical protein [Gammaproteobacteria bacterium]